MHGHTPVVLSVVRNITFIGTLSHENNADHQRSRVVNDSTPVLIGCPPYSIKSRWAHPVEKTEPNHPAFRKTALVTNSWLQTWKNGITKSTKKWLIIPPRPPQPPLPPVPPVTFWFWTQKMSLITRQKSCIQIVIAYHFQSIIHLLEFMQQQLWRRRCYRDGRNSLFLNQDQFTWDLSVFFLLLQVFIMTDWHTYQLTNR